MLKRMGLGELKKGERGIIVGVQGNLALSTDRLLEMGFLEGSKVEVVHESPFGGDPIAVRVRGALVALRRHEANTVEVTLMDPKMSTGVVKE